MLQSDFSSILFRAAQFAGLDRSAITDQTFALLRDLANGRIAWIWEQDAWEELIRVASAVVVTNGDNTKTVTLGAGVGDLLSVYDKNPRLGSTARSIQYFLYDDGTNRLVNCVDPLTTSPVWIEYRAAKPDLFGDAYSATVAYSVGAQIYFDTSTNTGAYTPGAGKKPAGNLYACSAATSAGQTPVTHAASWAKVEIPAAFLEYIARGVAADFWRSEGQFEKAAAAEGDASAAADRLVDLQSRQRGQAVRLNVVSY